MGQKYAVYLNTGEIQTYRDSTFNPVKPGEQALAITDEQWRACISTHGYTVVNGKLVPPPEPSADQLLKAAQASQTSKINSAYATALNAGVTFVTEAGVSKLFQSDATSRATCAQQAQAYTAVGSVPEGFYWKAADNTEVPFTLKDLNGLNSALTAQQWELFQKKSALKASIASATTVKDVQAVVWS